MLEQLKLALPSKFWDRIYFAGNCWLWKGATNRGYGRFHVSRGKQRPVHRMTWEVINGPVPSGKNLDHLCRNKTCVNPSHLECVPIAVNALRGNSPHAQHARQTHCFLGHPLSGENLFINSRGNRVCLICNRSRRRISRIRCKVARHTVSSAH